MKVIYHSALNDIELIPGNIYRVVPGLAFLKLHREKNDSQITLIYNGTIIDSNIPEIECNEGGELIIRQDGDRWVYSVRPIVKTLSAKYARSYEQFLYEYSDKHTDEISSIQLGNIKLYAVEQSTEIHDWTDVFEQIEDSFSAFKNVCERPKTHLKSVNEVRTIETVKRIGYESIPYLAAHSEDWLARTASGLKPARLFSRVEEDEFQIYENRVVKTLIDLILAFLRKTEKQLRDQRDQLRGIMNSSVQTGSFGFDESFQRAVSELISVDDKGDDYRSKRLALVDKLQEKVYSLLKKYRALRKTKLYRYLKKSKPVSNPLNETNILVLDEYYNVIYKLWKTIHSVVAPKVVEDEEQIAFEDICSDYQQFCSTLCGYAAHVLGFQINQDGRYCRDEDHIALTINLLKNGIIDVELLDTEPREMILPGGIDAPITAGSTQYRISYDGYKLCWPNDITVDEIDNFCSLHKTRASRGREQSEEKRKYSSLKALFDEKQRGYEAPKKIRAKIVPVAVQLDTDNRAAFRRCMEECLGEKTADDNELIVVALPLCEDSEQKIVDYARRKERSILFLPLTMFDINSFRRMQNVLYRMILLLEKNSCPNCGGRMRLSNGQRVCDNCNQLTLTTTICPNPECRHEYTYMEYDVSAETIEKMEQVDQCSFFQRDSLYQYKNIVDMTVKSGKLRTVCPCCGQS